ncbi:MAG: molybdopterin converting factor subunit 1 [Chromatiales bacterium]|nr:molybdopterin converting factor subunit 1 [Chromatiales bacterium]
MARLLYFARLRETLGSAGEELPDLPEGVTRVDALIDHLARRGPTWRAALRDDPRVLIAVNQVLVARDHAIGAADEIAFMPPVTGG